MVDKKTELAKVSSDHSESGMNFDGFFLFGIWETVQKMNAMFCDKEVVVELDGVTVTINSQDVKQPWRDRLDGILKVVQEASEDAGLDPQYVCRSILEKDGWTWTSKTFRTPTWIMDFDEIPRSMAAEEFEGLKWLEKSSLETK